MLELLKTQQEITVRVWRSSGGLRKRNEDGPFVMQRENREEGHGLVLRSPMDGTCYLEVSNVTGVGCSKKLTKLRPGDRIAGVNGKTSPFEIGHELSNAMMMDLDVHASDGSGGPPAGPGGA